MKKFEAETLEKVYELAKEEFKCSIIDLEIEVIQQPTSGFLGIGKKKAIICAQLKNLTQKETKPSDQYKNKKIKIEEATKKIENQETITQKDLDKQKLDQKDDDKFFKAINIEQKEKIFENFYEKTDASFKDSKIIIKKTKNEILHEIKDGITLLFSNSCYKIDTINVSFYDEKTVYIEFLGQDSALLIGKEGYRYKALSYILFNWINDKYDLMVRLEVAEFLKNQEEAINAYLTPVIEQINQKGIFKTKPLDGILIHIALTKLRNEFPNKYVAIKTNTKGEKYILVNEYKEKEI